MTRRRAEFDPTAPLPPLLTIDEIATIYRLSTKTIRRRLQKGIFRPLYWDRNPYRWRREDVEQDLATRRTNERLQQHGYSSSRGRPIKVAVARDARTSSHG